MVTELIIAVFLLIENYQYPFLLAFNRFILGGGISEKKIKKINKK